MGRTAGPYVGGPNPDSLRSDAVPQPYGRGDSRFPAARSSRWQAREASGSLFAACRHQRASGSGGRRAGAAQGGSRPRGRDDGIGVGWRVVRRVSGAALPRRRTEGARSIAGPGGVLRRGELQHRDRVRVHRSQRDERDELRVGDDCGGRGVPRRAGRPSGYHARRRCRSAARAPHVRRLQRHPRHEHAQ